MCSACAMRVLCVCCACGVHLLCVVVLCVRVVVRVVDWRGCCMCVVCAVRLPCACCVHCVCDV